MARREQDACKGVVTAQKNVWIKALSQQTRQGCCTSGKTYLVIFLFHFCQVWMNWVRYNSCFDSLTKKSISIGILYITLTTTDVMITKTHGMISSRYVVHSMIFISILKCDVYSIYYLCIVCFTWGTSVAMNFLWQWLNGLCTTQYSSQ